ncbi:uncharacterized protein LOC109805734 [Cajanus cajan]|uniref:CDK-activating kinase assembly factor MAT1 n=1 Tax=Cajanus cajan TaxID=3821 RepID=A0A151SVU1_CAJCA|nr:uncharacterized protein LOC109805734 [Cajanus cajan]KYP58909.1 CDK-activating kinase assembly factor MAT1 [Cajanus cajan]
MVSSSTNPFNEEIAIRRRINSIFNKLQDDFPSLKVYNDYKEEVEVMILNLTEGIDVAAIEEKIAKYQEENAEQININHAREAEELAVALASCKGQPDQTNNDMGASEKSEAGFGVDPQGQNARTFPGGNPRPSSSGPQPIPLAWDDIFIHSDDDEETKRLKRLRANAAGWSTEITRKRALEEAFGSMWAS